MTTTDQIKFIVGKLAEPPFNKTYNLISFDSLEMFTLLQTLSDVVLSIEEKVCEDCNFRKIIFGFISFVSLQPFIYIREEGANSLLFLCSF